MKRLHSACAGALAATLISLFGLSGCAGGNSAHPDSGFAVEQIGAEYVLVAHRQTDGLAQWSASLGNFPPGVQAPILVGGLAIIATGSSIQAFNAGDGSSAWSASIAGASTTLSFPGGAIGTNMAAAAGSRTLVVTSFTAIYVLDVTTGAEQWMGQIPGAFGRPHDPVIVGQTVYVVDSGQFPDAPGLISLQSAGPSTQ